MRGICLLAVLLSTGAAAHADELSEARAHYRKGTKLYDLQRYLEAAREYELAYEQKEEPTLLFNIGQSYRFGGETQKAIGAYRSYLRRLPDADNRSEVQAKIAELQHQLDEQKQKPPAPVVVPPEPAPSPPVVVAPPEKPAAAPAPVADDGRGKRIAGYAVGGVGVVGLALGITFAVLASSANDELGHPASNTRFDPSLEDRIKTDQALEAAFFAVGGAAIVTGVALLVVGRHREPPRVSLAPSLTPHYAGARLGIEF